MAGKVDRPLEGRAVVLVGRFAGANQAEIAGLVASHGGIVWPRVRPGVSYIVLGEGDYPLGRGSLPESDRRRLIDQAGGVKSLPRFLSESELWEWLGLLELRRGAVSVYTLGLAAQLCGLERWVLRRWIRLGLLKPRLWVFRSPYLDFTELSIALELSNWVRQGIPLRRLEAQLDGLAQWLSRWTGNPDRWVIRCRGRSLLLEGPAGWVDSEGQLILFPADEADGPPGSRMGNPAAMGGDQLVPEKGVSPLVDRLIKIGRSGGFQQKVNFDGGFSDQFILDAGDLVSAIEAERLQLATAGPTAERCFQLAELLYQAGQLQAARERYWMALELDENFVEARVNLGCVLAELGEYELALAAFRGALELQPDYADAHWHLACTLDRLGRLGEAREHWAAYLRWVPAGPWAEVARSRLAALPDDCPFPSHADSF